jgi:ABC-type transport system involved in multi-copper enzyme maturation permease subunit
MSSLIKLEIKKLSYDKEFILSVGLIVFYLVYSFLVLDEPKSGTSFTSWIDSRTRDSVFMVFFIGLATVAVFTSDYDYKTYKNVIPQVGMPRVFLSKVLTNVIALLVLLCLWYVITVVLSMIKASSVEASSLAPTVFRFFTQFCLLLFHCGMLVLVSTVFRHRGIASICTVLGWLAYAFIPVMGAPFYEYIVLSYQWGANPNILLCFFLVLFHLVCCVVAGAISFKREVPV